MEIERNVTEQLIEQSRHSIVINIDDMFKKAGNSIQSIIEKEGEVTVKYTIVIKHDSMAATELGIDIKQSYSKGNVKASYSGRVSNQPDLYPIYADTNTEVSFSSQQTTVSTEIIPYILNKEVIG